MDGNKVEKYSVFLALWFLTVICIIVTIVLIALIASAFNPCHAQDLKIPGFHRFIKLGDSPTFLSQNCYHRALAIDLTYEGPIYHAFIDRYQCRISDGFVPTQEKAIHPGRSLHRFTMRHAEKGYRLLVIMDAGKLSGKVRGVIR